MTNKTTTQRDAETEQARRDAAGNAAAPAPGPEVHTYADGSQRVGTAPFPKESPMEQAAAAKNEPDAGATPMYIPKGMKTSGEAAPSPIGGVTAEQFKARVEQQVESDVMSGKDPATPNPTTASDKPELANVVQVGDIQDALDPLSADDIARATKGIKPDVDASKEQIDAAALQVARETKGLIPSKKK